MLFMIIMNCRDIQGIVMLLVSSFLDAVTEFTGWIMYTHL